MYNASDMSLYTHITNSMVTLIQIPLNSRLVLLIFSRKASYEPYNVNDGKKPRSFLFPSPNQVRNMHNPMPFLNPMHGRK